MGWWRRLLSRTSGTTKGVDEPSRLAYSNALYRAGQVSDLERRRREEIQASFERAGQPGCEEFITRMAQNKGARVGWRESLPPKPRDTLANGVQTAETFGLKTPRDFVRAFGSFTEPFQRSGGSGGRGKAQDQIWWERLFAASLERGYIAKAVVQNEGKTQSVFVVGAVPGSEEVYRAWEAAVGRITTRQEPRWERPGERVRQRTRRR